MTSKRHATNAARQATALVALVAALLTAALAIPGRGAGAQAESTQLATPDVVVDASEHLLGETVEFSWEAVDNAVDYNLQVNQPFCDLHRSGLFFHTVTSTSTSCAISETGNYCLRARATPANNNGVYATSEWSAWVCSRFDAPPAPPTGPELCGATPYERCYAPLVSFHPDEGYFPDDPERFVRDSELWFANDGLCLIDEPVDRTPSPSLIASGVYRAAPSSLDITWSGLVPVPVCRSEADDYDSTEFTRPFSDDSASAESARPPELDLSNGFYLKLADPDDRRGQLPVNGVVTAPILSLRLPDDEDPARDMITYLMFYPYDPKAASSLTVPLADNEKADWLSAVDGFLAHEGDWERIDIVLNNDDAPDFVRFYGHGCPFEGDESATYRSTHLVPWSELEPVDSTHPVVLVAEGSHASYPFEREAGISSCPEKSSAIGLTDRVAAGGPQWRSWEGAIVDPRDSCWYGFGGAWGDLAASKSFEEDLFGGFSFIEQWNARTLFTHGTGPAGPFHNLRGGIAVEAPQSCDAPAVAWPIDDSQLEWGDEEIIVVSSLAPATEVTLTLASVEASLTSVTADASGTATLRYTMPSGTPPGVHTLRVRNTASGDVLGARRVTVVPPAECRVVEAGVDDLDDDGVIDGCDPNPYDGPTADADGDGVANADDVCPRAVDPLQELAAAGTQGAACDERGGHNPLDGAVTFDQYELEPIAFDDVAQAVAGEAVDLPVIVNDLPFAAIDPASVRPTSDPLLGTVEPSPLGDGSLRYSPAGFGSDEFTYEACNRFGLCTSALVRIEVEPRPTDLGDANCDGSINVVDALVISQFTVGIRSDAGGCPLPVAATDLHELTGDVNGDGSTTIVDALMIAQCDVGVPNVFCPAP